MTLNRDFDLVFFFQLLIAFCFFTTRSISVFGVRASIQVKLADFGTADVNPMTIGAPVGEGHFTTLENTPMEQLCCGSEARQVKKRS